MAAEARPSQDLTVALNEAPREWSGTRASADRHFAVWMDNVRPAPPQPVPDSKEPSHNSYRHPTQAARGIE